MRFIKVLEFWIDTSIGKSPLAPLCQRGVIPPFSKGRLGGILQINVVIAYQWSCLSLHISLRNLCASELSRSQFR